jgi:membrane-bound lytic murein transglycosylase MltF
VSARSYARSMVSVEEYVALHELIMRESSWNPEAQNPKSTAYGLGQFLDKTWELVGIEKSDDFRIQLIAAHKYVIQRYGSWQKALEFHKRNGYY